MFRLPIALWTFFCKEKWTVTYLHWENVRKNRVFNSRKEAERFFNHIERAGRWPTIRLYMSGD